jgi:myo-inositol-1(or 4)-monophosphatase
MLSKVDLQGIERFAVELAWGVGQLLLEYFQKPIDVEYKSKERQRDPVSEADRQAETFIKEQVSKRFPDHGIIGEEGAGEGDEIADCTWVVDPLDGTTNFVNGFPVFASSIAMLDKGVPVVAAIFIPWPSQSRGVVLHAHKGGGSWDGEKKLQVRSGDQIIPNGLVGVPRWFDRMFTLGGFLQPSQGERRVSGSVVYELAMVASGVLQYSVHRSPYIWDVAAGILLVQEAGGGILTRGQRGNDWHSFEAFSFPYQESTQQDMRLWQAPILAANPERVRLLGGSLTPRRYRIRPLIRRLRAKFRFKL